MAYAPETQNQFMPSRNHHSAPRFDGKPASLWSFLDEVEQLAKICGITGKQTISAAIRYAPVEEYELWKMQDSVGTDNWEQFKEELFDLYPGSTGERRYSVANLQSLAKRQALAVITNAKEFGAYQRSFMTVASFLKGKSHLSDREISSYFMQGLDHTLRTKVKDQLKAENPRHHLDDPYSLSEISTVALFVLSCSYNDTTSNKMLTRSPAKKEHYSFAQIDQPYATGNLNVTAFVSELVRQLSLQQDRKSVV